MKFPIDGCYSEGSQMPDVTKILFWSLQKWDWNVVSFLQQHLNESKEVGYVLSSAQFIKYEKPI